MSNGKSTLELVHQVATTVLAAGIIAMTSIMWSMRDTVLKLDQIHEREWPREIDRLSFELAKLESQIATNEAEIDRLKTQLERNP